MAIKVLIVDDQEIVRVGLITFLNADPDLQVVGEASSPAEALAKTNLLQPDIVIMDIRMPGGSGIEACREIISKYPSIKVLILTSYSDEEAVVASIIAGAHGYILKQIGSKELIEAIYKVINGQSMLDPGVTSYVFDLLKKGIYRPGEKSDCLSQQEETILKLIAKGKTNKEIAKEIFLSEKTIRNYVSTILAEMNFHHRAEAAVYAAKYLS
jgi:two-component system, NarL family, response regulator DevR